MKKPTKVEALNQIIGEKDLEIARLREALSRSELAHAIEAEKASTPRDVPRTESARRLRLQEIADLIGEGDNEAMDKVLRLIDEMKLGGSK